MSTRKMAFLFACMSVGALASACGDEVGGMLLNCTPGEVQCVDEDYMQACIGVSWVKTECPAKCNSSTGQCNLTPDMECAVTTCKAGVKNVLIECSPTFKATEVECGEGQECQYNQCVDVDLCRVGAVKCSPDNSGTMTCDENGKWGSVVSCGDMVCDSESHVCKDKSEAKVCDAGAKKCDGNKALVCGENAWTSEDCGSKVCKDGVCEDSGEAKCSAGELKCDGSKLLKCDANGAFVEDKDCAADGQICQNNSCVENSEGACSAGDLKCEGSKLLKCDDNGSFVEDKDCAADGLICQNNACVANVADSCSEGQIKCVEDGGSKYVSCDGNAWGTAESECDANMICNKGACVVKICDDGDERCSSDSMGIEKCSGNVWSVDRECTDGMRCDAIEFACKAQSEAKICKEGEQQCDGSGRIKTCKADNTWEESTECDAETPVCNEDLNACVAKACEEGAMECTGSNSLKVCSGGIWGVNVCVEGSVCENNQCVAKSADICTGSEKSCSNDKGAVMVCDNGVWKVDTDCSADGKACDASGEAPVCVVSCNAECDGDKIKRCDAEGKLGESEDCGTNKVCSVSGDVASCVDKAGDEKCAANEKACDGTDKIKVCDDKGEWGSSVSCGAGMKCDEATKACVTDPEATTCTKGEKRCVTDAGGDNVYQTCGNDGKWGAVQTCDRNRVCSSGNCVVCVPGTTVCQAGWSSNNLNTCKADGSGYDSKACANGCQNGACLECQNNEMKCTDEGVFQICRNGAWVEYDCGAKDKCSTKTGMGSTPGCVCNSGRNADIQCAANGDVQTCTQQGGGFGGQAYSYWATTMSCGEGMCENNKCKCSNGDKRCSSDNSALETCDKNGAWTASRCGADMVCDASKKACVCEENDVRCHLNNNRNEVQTCKNGEWKTDKTCDRNDTCNVALGGVCLKDTAVACTGLDNNTKNAIARQEGLDASAIGVSCKGNVLYTCDSGVSSEMQTCSIACQEATIRTGVSYAYCATKASTPDTTCYRANELRCSDDGSEVQKCVRGSGWSMTYNWQMSEDCKDKVCQNNKCVDRACEEGAYDCNGTNITICRNNKVTDIVNCNDYGKKCDKGVCVVK